MHMQLTLRNLINPPTLDVATCLLTVVENHAVDGSISHPHYCRLMGVEDAYKHSCRLIRDILALEMIQNPIARQYICEGRLLAIDTTSKLKNSFLINRQFCWEKSKHFVMLGLDSAAVTTSAAGSSNSVACGVVECTPKFVDTDEDPDAGDESASVPDQEGTEPEA